jgi:hypothetical protein
MWRYFCSFLAGFLVSCDRPAPTSPSPQTTIQDVPARAPISADPLFDPSKPRVNLPAAALAQPDGDERFAEEPIGRWRHWILDVSDTVDTSVSIAAPSILLVKAISPQQYDFTVSVLKDEAVLASARTSLGPESGPENGRIATARVEVPSAGHLVVRTITGSVGPVRVELYVGVVERPPKP